MSAAPEGPSATEDTAGERRRTEAERRRCSQPGCPGDGRYSPPGKGHWDDCPHDALKWAWDTVPATPDPVSQPADASESIIASLRARLDVISALADHLVGNEAAPLIREALNGYTPLGGKPRCEGRTPFDCGNPTCPAHPAPVWLRARADSPATTSTTPPPTTSVSAREAAAATKALTDAADASEGLSEAEALASVIYDFVLNSPRTDWLTPTTRAVLASDWLAEVKAAAATKALTDAADAWTQGEWSKTLGARTAMESAQRVGDWLRARARRIH